MIINEKDPLLRGLNAIVRGAVHGLALLMVIIILLGLLEAAVSLIVRIRQPPPLILDIQSIVDTFGTIMAVLIAVELFATIVLLLRGERGAVEMVLATALTALARKLIILDYDHVSVGHLWGTAAAILALAIGYRLSSSRSDREP